MGDADADLARRAWRAMSDVVLDHDRKVAVSEPATPGPRPRQRPDRC
jgi:hypothetical protein